MLALLSCGSIFAQQVLPAGTILPGALNTSVNTDKVKPGAPIKPTVMQDVTVGSPQISPESSAVCHSSFGARERKLFLPILP